MSRGARGMATRRVITNESNGKIDSQNCCSPGGLSHDRVCRGIDGWKLACVPLDEKRTTNCASVRDYRGYVVRLVESVDLVSSERGDNVERGSEVSSW